MWVVVFCLGWDKKIWDLGFHSKVVTIMSRCKWEQLELDSFQNVLNKNTETCLIAVLQLCTFHATLLSINFESQIQSNPNERNWKTQYYFHITFYIMWSTRTTSQWSVSTWVFVCVGETDQAAGRVDALYLNVMVVHACKSFQEKTD